MIVNSASLFDDENKQKIHDVACEILKPERNGKGERLKVVIPKIIENIPEGIPEYLIYRTLLDASRSDFSPIQSGGPWKGYFLDRSRVVEPSEEQEEDQPEIQVNGNKLLEKHLYPLVAFWMREKKEFGRVSSDVANFRKGKTWSNPDVVALNLLDRLGFFDVEIVTAEVKISDHYWRQYIFEAVSHRRYADRAYFVYRSGNGIANLDQEMIFYAEKFAVGIAVIDLPDDRVNDLTNWDKLSYAERLEFADSIIEVAPAPYDTVSMRDKCQFLDYMKISYKDQLQEFGSTKR